MKHVPMQHAILASLAAGRALDAEGSPLVWALGYLWNAGCVEIDSATFANARRVTGLTDTGREVLADWNARYRKVEV